MDKPQFTQKLRACKDAATVLARLSSHQRADLILSIGASIAAARDEILAANDADVAESANSSVTDRLLLTTARIDAMAGAATTIADMPDVVGVVLEDRTIDDGLTLQRVSVPLGLIGVIYESRPNVTCDATVLALKSGNAVVLRGGSDAHHSNHAIVAAVSSALREHHLSDDTVWLMPPDRELVGHLLTAVGLVDVLIPRGSEQLINFVRAEATVPTIETGAGVCHTYVTDTADLGAAARVVLNAKLQRPTVCNALDTLVVDRTIVSDFLPLITAGFGDHAVTVFADDSAFEVMSRLSYTGLSRARESDFGREFLDYACSIKTVDGFDDAVSHIRRHSSRHSEAIMTTNVALGERFLAEVDAAVVMVNASTRFTDGEVFGLGAEMGISTQKLHARGPFGFEKLVTEKWLVRGGGQVRADRATVGPES